MVSYVWIMWLTPWTHTLWCNHCHTVSMLSWILLLLTCSTLQHTFIHDSVAKYGVIYSHCSTAAEEIKTITKVYKINQEGQSHLPQFCLQYSISDNHTPDMITFKVTLGNSFDRCGCPWPYTCCVLLLLIRKDIWSSPFCHSRSKSILWKYLFQVTGWVFTEWNWLCVGIYQRVNLWKS